MPMYDYLCERCSVQFEVRQSFSDDTLTVCPAEGGPAACVSPGEGAVKKVFSGVAISFKGDGFYKNDHGANAQGRRKEKDKESSSSKDSSDSSSSADSSSNGSSEPKSSKSDSDSGSTKTSTADAGAGKSSASASSPS